MSRRFTLYKRGGLGILVGVILMMGLTSLQAAQVDLVPMQTVNRVALNNATALWGEVYAADPIPYYGLDDEIIAYMYSFRKAKPFPDYATIQAVTTQPDPWGKDEYCHITVNARYTDPPIEEYGEFLSEDLVWKKNMEDIAKNELRTSSVELVRIYSINPFNKWYLYVNLTRTDSAYVNPFPPSRVYSPSEFEVLVREYFLNMFAELDKAQAGILSETEPGDYRTKWAEQEVEVDLALYDENYIPLYDSMPFFDWHLGCVPTAASMCLGYYDRIGILQGFDNYGRLVEYYFTDYDVIQGDTDTQNPDILPILADKMDTHNGSTQRLKVSDAIEELVQERGYSCDADGHGSLGGGAYFLDPSYRGDLVDEIVAGRPCMFHIPGHSTAAVGYRKETGEGDADKAIVHNTWNKTLQWFNCGRSRNGYCIFSIELSNPGSGSIRLLWPTGDTTYNGNGSAVPALRGGDTCSILWQTNIPGSGMVIIYYRSPETGTITLANTSNTGSYLWDIPDNIASTRDGRIDLVWKDSRNNTIDADGSFGPFALIGGGNVPGLTGIVRYDEEPPNRYKCRLLSNNHWAVTGVRPPQTGGKREVRLYSDTLFNYLQVTDEIPSAASPQKRIGFVVCCADHVNTPRWLGVDFYEALPDPAPLQGVAQYNSSGYLGWGRNDLTWAPGEVGRMYDLSLPLLEFESSTDTIWIKLAFDGQDPSVVTDMGIALYDRITTYQYDNRETPISLDRYADASGDGGDEIIELTNANIFFINDTCGLVVFAKDESPFLYNFGIEVFSSRPVTAYDPLLHLTPGSVFQTAYNPTTLTYDKIENTPGVIGVKPSEGSGWSMLVTEDPSPGIEDTLVYSCYGYPFTNFCVLDFERLDSLPEMKLVRCGGGGEAKVQYDPGSGELSLGTNGPFVWDAEDIVKIWTLDLGTLSEYLLPDYVFTIRLDVSGNAELNAGAICPPESEEDEVCLGRGEMAGVFSEDSTWAFRGDAGPYGIVVWSDNEKSATFSIIITQEWIGQEEVRVPTSYSFSVASASPFDYVRKIRYELPEASCVDLKIYNAAGQLVKTLVDSKKQAGSYEVIWNCRDDPGVKVPGGIYFCHFETADFQATRKLILLK